jgi:hypothetical protein
MIYTNAGASVVGSDAVIQAWVRSVSVFEGLGMRVPLAQVEPTVQKMMKLPQFDTIRVTRPFHLDQVGPAEIYEVRQVTHVRSEDGLWATYDERKLISELGLDNVRQAILDDQRQALQSAFAHVKRMAGHSCPDCDSAVTPKEQLS